MTILSDGFIWKYQIKPRAWHRWALCEDKTLHSFESEALENQQIVIKIGCGSECIFISDIISPDVLTLVRHGLRRADDPKILDTLTLLIKCLKWTP